MKSNKRKENNNNKAERVKVYIRIHPFSDDEKKIGGETPFKSIDIKIVFFQ